MHDSDGVGVLVWIIIFLIIFNVAQFVSNINKIDKFPIKNAEQFILDNATYKCEKTNELKESSQ